MNKKFLILIITTLIAVSSISAISIAPCAFAQETVLKTSISIDKVPKELYGTWRVKAKLVSTNNENIFKPSSTDLWNLSRVGNVITLDNPFSGAKASISIDEVNGKTIKFRKIGNYDDQKLTDTVELNLSTETFTGINNLKLDKASKSDWATYKLSGEKISGDSVK